MAPNINHRLHHHKPHHGQRRATREQANENEQRQNDLRPATEQHNQGEQRVNGLQVIARRLSDAGQDLERQRALIRKQQEVQSAKTDLARETARSDSAKSKVDLELDTHRSVNQAIKEGAKNPPTVVIK